MRRSEGPGPPCRPPVLWEPLTTGQLATEENLRLGLQMVLGDGPVPDRSGLWAEFQPQSRAFPEDSTEGEALQRVGSTLYGPERYRLPGGGGGRGVDRTAWTTGDEEVWVGRVWTGRVSTHHEASGTRLSGQMDVSQPLPSATPLQSPRAAYKVATEAGMKGPPTWTPTKAARGPALPEAELSAGASVAPGSRPLPRQGTNLSSVGRQAGGSGLCPPCPQCLSRNTTQALGPTPLQTKAQPREPAGPILSSWPREGLMGLGGSPLRGKETSMGSEHWDRTGAPTPPLPPPHSSGPC